ncbi:hypothetical protein RIF29_21317 [Crotalaria pallida]|uniref:NB-ARC domain-containing protein n=1 Tax=Crotalaria pallida TaxID=3830 RepID=A0AAN9I9D9_CROPI
MNHYQEELEALDESIRRFFELDMQVQKQRDAVGVHFHTLNTLVFGGRKPSCSPPKPPSFTVGLDVPMRQLKLKLLQDQVGVSVINVTGLGGSGKTTLAKMLCQDDQIKGKFKDKIFFLTFGKMPKLNKIVQNLFQHSGYQVPGLQSNDDTLNQLEHFLKQIGSSPVLLILDDVWPGSESFVEKFVFQISGYKILVTSRFTIGRFGPPYVLKPLAYNDAIKLFRHSASLNQSSSYVPNNVLEKVLMASQNMFLKLHSQVLMASQNMFLKLLETVTVVNGMKT